MKSKWVVTNGKRIWYTDCSNCGMDTQAVRNEMLFAISMIEKEPTNSVLSLCNVSGIRATPEIFSIFKESVKKIEPYAAKRAIVGITGAQKTFIDLINKISGTKTFRMFDKIEDAQKWLTEN